MTTIQNQKAFTLIELLVVIAIIALLSSILVPTLHVVKEKGKNLSCQTNVRSLAVAFRMYTETNSGKVFGYGSGGEDNLWLLQIADLLDDINEVRYCPSTKITDKTDSGFGSATENWIWDHDVPQSQQGSYGINGFLYSSTPTYVMPDIEWQRSAWENVNTVARSISVPVFIDAMWIDLWPQDNDVVPANHNLQLGDIGGNGPDRNHMLRCMLNRHGGAMSVSFLDGHVEPVQLERMWSLKWSKIFDPKAQDQLRTDDTPIYKK